MRRTRLTTIIAATAALGACRIEPAVRLGDAHPISAATTVGTAPTFALSPTGREAVAWISAPGGGTDGRLHVAAGAGQPAELRDSLGPIEAHGEAPPKLSYGPDGALNALYVVGKVVPGERFPLGALRFARSADGGANWSAPVTVTDDSVFGSHNFHSLHAAPNGALYVAWLDGREGKSAVFVTRSTDGGRTWQPNQRVSAGEACPCCRTAIAASADGMVYLAWRAVLPGNVRDVVVARSADGGATWAEPVRVHADGWKFDGCPHAGPSLQVDTSGRVHVAWWTGREKRAGVYYARSTDGGRTFGAPLPLGVAEFSKPSHVQLALGPDGTVAAAWEDGTLQQPEVLLRVSRDGGSTFAEPQTLSAQGRAVGFPVVAVTGDSVAVAWSEESAGAAARTAAAMPDMRNPSATMGLSAVGEAQVMVRRGAIR